MAAALASYRQVLTIPGAWVFSVGGLLARLPMAMVSLGIVLLVSSRTGSYGLAGAVWTRDIFRAFRVVKKLRAGVVWVNHMQPTYVEAPWGGMKMSGVGRELGRYGVEGYLELKQVHVNLSERPVGWY